MTGSVVETDCSAVVPVEAILPSPIVITCVDVSTGADVVSLLADSKIYDGALGVPPVCGVKAFVRIKHMNIRMMTTNNATWKDISLRDADGQVNLGKDVQGRGSSWSPSSLTSFTLN